jgi:hypothetical protein
MSGLLLDAAPDGAAIRSAAARNRCAARGHLL